MKSAHMRAIGNAGSKRVVINFGPEVGFWGEWLGYHMSCMFVHRFRQHHDKTGKRRINFQCRCKKEKKKKKVTRGYINVMDGMGEIGRSM